MKKILPAIFIALILVNIFAPFSVEVGTQNLIQSNKAEASGGTFRISISPDSSGTFASITGTYEFTGTPNGTKSVLYGGTDQNNLIVLPFKNQLPDVVSQVPQPDSTNPIPNRYSYSFKYNYTGLTAKTTYYIQVEVSSSTGVIEKSSTQSFASGGTGVLQDNSLSVAVSDAQKKAEQACAGAASTSPECTAAKQALIDAQKAYSDTQPSADKLPSCGFFGDSSIGGCAAQLIYYVLFVPTSYVFALTGQFFDWAFGYSVSNAAYQSPFVIQGWGIVRDFCNIFFIFVLLYVAFSTILSIHGFKTKEMIINVVIIGLLINFSLFAAQVIIDTSNILARVFYNSDTIKITQNGANCTTNSSDPNCLTLGQGTVVGSGGTIPLSAALVNKINPQYLIRHAGEVSVVDPQTGATSSGSDTSSNLGVGAFILVTLLATAVNVVGLVVFLSVAMMFIARVIGLWLAMIFVPLAFFSYTVPAMQGISMVGWKHWWPETLKLAFLAPVFIFFLYLIIKFLDTGLSLIHADGQRGTAFVIATVVPFAFIMMLLWRAKSIAKDMSGTIGQSITGGVAAIGGLALGGAVGGAALLGRSTIGRLANKADKSEWLNDAASGKKGRAAQFLTKNLGLKSATSFISKGSFDARQTAAGNAFSKETGMNLNRGTSVLGLDTKKGLGGYRGEQERKIERDNKFGESLGYNHHVSERMEDKINTRKDDIAKAEAEQSRKKAEVDAAKGTSREKAANRAYSAAQQVVTNLKSGDPNATGDAKKSLANLEKDLERNKTGRQKEYALTRKRKSGKIYEIDKAKTPEEIANYRDEFGNIKKFGHAEKAAMHGVVEAMKEAGLGFAKGAGVGMVGGSIVLPGVGTLVGGLGGGLAAAIRELLAHSGTTNRQVGEAHGDKHEKPVDNYKPPAPSHAAPSAAAPAAGGGGDHGGHH